LLERTTEADTHKQTLYVYEPNSFVPLAMLRSHHPKAPPPQEAKLGLASELLTLRDQNPEIWQKVEAMQRKTAARLGISAEAMHQAVNDVLLPAKDELPDTSEVFYYHTDHLGTPRELTDADGNIVWSATYKAWGATQKIEYPPRLSIRVVGNTVEEVWEEQTEPFTQNLRFQGQYFDQETGLHYNRFRYYDPDVGQFVSQDPIKLAGGYNPGQSHLHSITH